MDVCVFTDLRFVSYRQPTGVGKHISQMVCGLGQMPGNRLSLLAARDQIRQCGTLPLLQTQELPMSWKMADAIWTLTGHPFADRWCGRPDWVYCPKNDFIPIRKSRVAVTVHGAHELDPLMPQLRALSARLNRLRRQTSYSRMLRQASLVLTVSEFLKEQLIQWFRVDPQKCCVVGNGVEAEFFQVAEQEPVSSGEPEGRPFILCVGGLNHLDGGDRVLRFASLLRTKAPDLKILVAGCQHEEEMRKAANELPNINLLGYLPAERLALYMRDSLALLFPTRYETFGIAAAEAMAAGTPVITCRCTAVPEVVGDAGLYVEPDRPEAILEAVTSLQSKSALRSDLIARGRKRASAHTWSACVARLNQALQQS